MKMPPKPEYCGSSDKAKFQITVESSSCNKPPETSRHQAGLFFPDSPSKTAERA
jgi:hypothetical protein